MCFYYIHIWYNTSLNTRPFGMTIYWSHVTPFTILYFLIRSLQHLRVFSPRKWCKPVPLLHPYNLFVVLSFVLLVHFDFLGPDVRLFVFGPRLVKTLSTSSFMVRKLCSLFGTGVPLNWFTLLEFKDQIHRLVIVNTENLVTRCLTLLRVWLRVYTIYGGKSTKRL